MFEVKYFHCWLNSNIMESDEAPEIKNRAKYNKRETEVVNYILQIITEWVKSETVVEKLYDIGNKNKLFKLSEN